MGFRLLLACTAVAALGAAGGSVGVAAASASSSSSGGASASPSTGGASPTVHASAPSGGAGLETAAAVPSPVAKMFHLSPPRIAVGDALPKIVLYVSGSRFPSARAYVQVTPPSGGGAPVMVPLGTVATGKTVQTKLRIPGRKIVAGSYALRLSVVDPTGRTLARSAKASGRTTLIVKAAAVKTPPTVVVPKPVTKEPAPTPVSGSGDTRFPVQGAHTFGGPDGRFGVGRTGHTHEGQDVPADQGTPVVAPTAGTVTFTGYQASAAGEWVAMHSVDGRDFFFAHCVRHSTVVSEGDALKPGTRLCDVGATGDADGPHLHFEIWIDGWRTSKASHPIDPLPQLQAWQAADPTR